MGFPKLEGGLGGFARYIAICPEDWKYGIKIGQLPESPLKKYKKRLYYDEKVGMRIRKNKL